MSEHVLNCFRLVDVNIDLCTSVFGFLHVQRSSISSGNQPHLQHLLKCNIHLRIKSRDLNAIDRCYLHEWLAKLSKIFSDVPFLTCTCNAAAKVV